MEFIKELWRGNVKLVITFWIVSFIGNALFATLGGFLEGIGFYDQFTNKKQFIILSFSIIFILFYFFTLVCVWKSSSKYTGRTLWATLAKIYVVIGAFKTITATVEVF